MCNVWKCCGDLQRTGISFRMFSSLTLSALCLYFTLMALMHSIDPSRFTQLSKSNFEESCLHFWASCSDFKHHLILGFRGAAFTKAETTRNDPKGKFIGTVCTEHHWYTYINNIKLSLYYTEPSPKHCFMNTVATSPCSDSSPRAQHTPHSPTCPQQSHDIPTPTRDISLVIDSADC